jgi:CRP/FNR family transcriptional regulator, anaerobic regulatory protein
MDSPTPIRPLTQLSCRNCALSRICLPAHMPPEEVAILERAVERRRELPGGASLIRTGQRMQGLFVVRDGSAKSYSVTVDGDEQVRGFHLPGEIVGLDAFAEERHLCEVVALEPVRYCHISAPTLERLMDQLPGLRREIVRLLSQSLEESQRLRAAIGASGARERLAGFLVDISSRLERRGLPPTQFRLSMSRRDIGLHLGLTLETVSRVLGAFRRAGWLDVRMRYIKVLRPDALAALAGPARIGRF